MRPFHASERQPDLSFFDRTQEYSIQPLNLLLNHREYTTGSILKIVNTRDAFTPLEGKRRTIDPSLASSQFPKYESLLQNFVVPGGGLEPPRPVKVCGF